MRARLGLAIAGPPWFGLYLTQSFVQVLTCPVRVGCSVFGPMKQTKQKNQRATLRSIADELGISVTTVSRVLNGKSQEFRIASATEKNVLEAADRLAFSPNLLARGLRLKATQIIGLLVPDIGNPFFSRIARCITEVAQSRGFSVLLCDSRDQTETEIDELEVLKARSVEGLVICPVGISHEHLENLANTPTPVVMLDRFLPQLNLPAVGCDNVAASRMAVEHLIENGHRGIAYLQGLVGTLPNQDRIEGYRQALVGHGLPFDENLVSGTGFSRESGYEATRHLLAERPQVTGIFAASNQCALGALRAVAEAGKSVPHDISIVTFDDIDNVEFMSTPITAVAQPVEAMGRAAVEILFDQISSQSKGEGPPVVFSAELIVRDSVRRIDVETNKK